jgi:hypothetical protein
MEDTMRKLRSLSPRLKRVAAALAAAGVVGMLTAASPALAHDGWDDGWRYRHHRHYHQGYYGYYGYGPSYYAPYYAPRPVYVPPPVYYAPPPAYYAPGVSFGLSFR